jgi:alpha-amylase
VVYFGSTSGDFYALQAVDGKEKWKYHTNGTIISSPVVADGIVLFGSSDGFAYALDAGTGKVKWMYVAEGNIVSSPAVADGVVYIGSESEQRSLHAVDLQTGKAIWKTPAGSIISSLAVKDGVIYGASVTGTLFAGKVEDAIPLWSNERMGVVISSPAITDELVIYGDMEGKIYAVDRQSGKDRWSLQTNGEVWSSPAVAGNTVFIGSADGYLYALDSRGPKLALAPNPTSMPIEPTPTLLHEPPQPSQTGTDGLPWWNERVFYEVFVRSFKDSNGDGIGDLQGLIDKLDYLNDGDPNTTTDLGVTGIWLMPIMQSPSYHGYDVTDFRQIEQDYGTNDDFKRLLAEAHKRGIAIIVDMVMNHTSNEHPWFKKAPYPGTMTENWYIWSPTDPGFQSPWKSQVWHKAEPANIYNPRAYHSLFDYYYGLFWSGMPDLNYENGAVTQEMFDILRFWLVDMGVDGFRLDAVRHLVEEGAVQENTPETHAWLQNFDNYVHTVKPDMMTIGEIWDETEAVVPYIPDEVDIAFEFKVAEAIIQGINDGNNQRLVEQTNTVLKAYPEGQFAPFLTNHDMTRVMTQLKENPDKAKLAATLALTYPGVPFIYYGEEIGLTGVKPEDINVRRPMQWDETPNAGFTSSTPWTELGTLSPTANVAVQTEDPDSLLSRYRDLIHLRQEHPALQVGDTWVVNSDAPQVFSLLRHSGDEAVLLVVNLSGEAQKGYKLNLEASGLQAGVKASLLLGEGQPRAPRVDAQGGFQSFTPLPELAPYGAIMILLQQH